MSDDDGNIKAEWNVNYEDLEFGTMIGKGNFGKVCALPNAWEFESFSSYPTPKIQATSWFSTNIPGVQGRTIWHRCGYVKRLLRTLFTELFFVDLAIKELLQTDDDEENKKYTDREVSMLT